MMHRVAILLLLLLPALRTKLAAQQYPLYRYSVEDGLANANVYRISQDKKGFLWFSTNYGLSRFDGKRFQNYYSVNGLSGNTVMSVSEDDRGKKWVCTYGGGICTLTDQGVAAPLQMAGYLPKSVYFSESWRNARWVIAVDSVRSLFCIRDNKVVRMKVAPFNKRVNFYKIVKAGDEIYFLSDKGIYTADEHYNLRPFLPELVSGKVTDIQAAGKGSFWVGMLGSILHIKNFELAAQYPLNGDEVTDMLLDRSGRLWISAIDGGIFLIDNDKMSNISGNVSIGNILINDVFEDNEGNIWFATHGEGACRLNSLDFIRFGIEKQKMHAYCKALAPYKDGLYTGSFGNVSYWQQGQLQPVTMPILKRHYFIYFIKIVDDRLYIGTPYGLIVKAADQRDMGRLFGTLGGVVGMISMCTDKKNTIWLGSYSALFRLEGEHPVKVMGGNVPVGKRINALIADSKDRLWLGTDSGIYIGNEGTFRHLPAPDFGAILSEYEDPQSGDIWFAAEKAIGLYRNEKLTLLPGSLSAGPQKYNVITGDGRGAIWAGCLNGLISIDPLSLQIRDYKTDLGEVLSIYCAGDQMFLGTVNGLSVIKPSGVDNKQAPKVYITSVTTDTGLISFPKDLHLFYRHNKVRIEYAALYYRFPKSIDYRYKIEGLDSAWHITGNSSLEIPALPSGDYRFLLSARKNMGQWGTPAVMHISVSTPLWRRPWFMVLSLLLLLGGAIWAIRFATGKIEAKKRRQLVLVNKMLYLKQQALGALINPHFIFNAMNSIQLYLNRHDNEKANRYLAEFAGLIRLTLHHAEDAFISLDQEISRLELYLSLEQLRAGEDLQFEIVRDSSCTNKDIFIPNMVLQPYVENAIWHGIIPKDEPGKILVLFSIQVPGIIHVLIEDDGVGYSEIKAAKNALRQKGLGMSLTRERLELFQKLLGKDFTVSIEPITNKDGHSAGSRVKFSLPYFSTIEEWKEMEKGYA